MGSTLPRARSQPGAGSRSGIPWLALGAISMGFAALIHGLWLQREFVHDDAYIALRYARNLLAGDGLVWNPGERVEGYTSLAAVLATSAVGSLGVDLLTAARWLNGIGWVSGGLALAVLLFGTRGRERVDPVAPAVALALMIAAPSAAVWIWGGLEAPLFAGAVALAAGLFVRWLECPQRRAGALAAGLALGALVPIRPDGGIFCLVAFAFALWHLARRGRSVAPAVAILALSMAALPALQLSFRLAYYDAWLPNSVVTKLAGLPSATPRGLGYLGSFVLRPPVPLIWSALLLVPALRSRAHRLPAAFAATCLLCYAAAVCYAGGDHMPAHRLLLPLAPLAMVVVFCGLAAWVQDRARAALAVICLAAALAHQAWGVRPIPADPAAVLGRVVAEQIRGRWPPRTTIALHTAGSTPYFAPDYRYIDMLGLNDAQIARRRVERARLPWQAVPGHAKGDGAYVLERDPDIIIAGGVMGSPVEQPLFLTDLELRDSPLFHERYRLRSERVDVRGVPQIGPHETETGFLLWRYYERVRR